LLVALLAALLLLVALLAALLLLVALLQSIFTMCPELGRRDARAVGCTHCPKALPEEARPARVDRRRCIYGVVRGDVTDDASSLEDDDHDARNDEALRCRP
jgi:hypothetical protein